MSTHQFTNRLIHESSVYLLQHAHNPVDWYAWSDEAFKRAIEEDKPVLVSIGYAACHWCHVMERESFEDISTAAIMNKHFINIKIDREERPDIDHIYMDALQAMTGSGGWPLNIFLTPDKKPFYGGTYFPPVRAFNRASWKETLYAVHESYTKRKHEINAQADNLTAYIEQSNSFGMRKMDEEQSEDFFKKEILQEATENILKSADTVWGGFGKAPKFPQSFTINFLLRHFYFTKHQASLNQALLSLDKMIQGGIYDQLGGGFARYSTDEKWLAPHFEKMLYDNALLLAVIAEAYQLTADEKYAETIKHTIAFIEREMTTDEFGFYSALDADSEGEEGKFYVWQKEEIDSVLENDSEIFCSVYNISNSGNWEHTNIPWLNENIEWHAEQMKVDTVELKQKLQSCKERLMRHRSKRIRPVTDDKIITGWNALMITALCKAYAASGNEAYLALAEKNILFLEKNCRQHNGAWFHTCKNGVAKYPAFLDDYSYLIQAYLHLQEVTGNKNYLTAATEIAHYVLSNFADADSPFFFYTSAEQTDVIVRKKEVYDGAVPSGNAVMAQNLLYLSIITGNKEWEQKVVEMLQALGQAVVRYPTSFGVWAMVLQGVIEGTNEIAIVGADAKALLSSVMQLYIPNKVVQASEKEDELYPLLNGKIQKENETKIYLCRNYSCKQPVNDANSLMKLLQNEFVI